jgi:hypothetical protein
MQPRQRSRLRAWLTESMRSMNWRLEASLQARSGGGSQRHANEPHRRRSSWQAPAPRGPWPAAARTHLRSLSGMGPVSRLGSDAFCCFGRPAIAPGSSQRPGAPCWRGHLLGMCRYQLQNRRGWACGAARPEFAPRSITAAMHTSLAGLTVLWVVGIAHATPARRDLQLPGAHMMGTLRFAAAAPPRWARTQHGAPFGARTHH